jgi:hypothetical protein
VLGDWAGDAQASIEDIIAHEDTQPFAQVLAGAPNAVIFNGVGGEACETFGVRLFDQTGDFCKTNYRPYDEVVVACLFALVANVPGSSWSSDGGRDEHDEGAALFATATGKARSYGR